MSIASQSFILAPASGDYFPLTQEAGFFMLIQQLLFIFYDKFDGYIGTF